MNASCTSNTEPVPDNSYSAALVTFKRPESLAVVLDALVHQTHPPTLIVVADNDPDESARSIVSNADDTTVPISYVPVGANLGPAGGWAAAVEFAQNQPNRGSWIGIFDDDDPLDDPDVMRLLLEGAMDAVSTSDRVAAVGLRGARLSRRRMRLRRAHVAEGSIAQVDYLAGNGAPIYRWDAIEQVGFFEPALFFGFEDLDQGLRLTADGWEVMALGLSLQNVADTAASRVAWREYYKTRALVTISRRHLGWDATAWLLVRSVLLGSVLLSIRDRSPSLAWARIVGSIDGLRGQLGVRRYHPASNPSKP